MFALFVALFLLCFTRPQLRLNIVHGRGHTFQLRLLLVDVGLQALAGKPMRAVLAATSTAVGDATLRSFGFRCVDMPYASPPLRPVAEGGVPSPPIRLYVHAAECLPSECVLDFVDAWIRSVEADEGGVRAVQRMPFYVAMQAAGGIRRAS